MKYLCYLLISCSIIFSSDLRLWIDNNSALIDKKSYKLEFKYLVTKKKKDIDRNSLNTTEFYSINTDSSIIRLDSRLTLSYKDYSEVIDLSSKQKFIQALDIEFNDFKSKLVSIFTDKNFKIIKISKNKYILSLNDYYINMNITYDKSNSYISDLFFYQAPYWIYIQDLAITPLDSIPYNYTDWDNYEVFDLR